MTITTTRKMTLKKHITIIDIERNKRIKTNDQTKEIHTHTTRKTNIKRKEQRDTQSDRERERDRERKREREREREGERERDRERTHKTGK